MTDKTIAAYDLPGRVASYDADMAIMHPNRAKMIQVALEVLPFPPERPLCALDLGVGTGFFTERFLRLYPRSQVLALDGAAAMVDLAKTRLGDAAERVRFIVGDFRRLSRLVGDERFDVVFSSYALHHLNRDDKQAVVRQARDLLQPGGWFVNADLLVAELSEIEDRIQELRVRGIVQRAGGSDARFTDAQVTRQFLDKMEAAEGDQPLSLLGELQVLRTAKLRGVTVFWLEYREAVCGGIK